MKATQQQVDSFKPGLYQHWKGPLYRALFLGQDSTNRFSVVAFASRQPLDTPVEPVSTEEPMVAYVSLDPGPHQGHICFRELWQWAERVSEEDWTRHGFIGARAIRFTWRGP